MSKPTICGWCGTAIAKRPGTPGRHPKFCSHSHRQLAYLARKKLQAAP